MDDKLQSLVRDLSAIVIKNTSKPYDDVQNLVTRLQDYVKEPTGTTNGVLNILNDLENLLREKKEKRPNITKQIQKVRDFWDVGMKSKDVTKPSHGNNGSPNTPKQKTGGTSKNQNQKARGTQRGSGNNATPNQGRGRGMASPGTKSDSGNNTTPNRGRGKDITIPGTQIASGGNITSNQGQGKDVINPGSGSKESQAIMSVEGTKVDGVHANKREADGRIDTYLEKLLEAFRYLLTNDIDEIAVCPPQLIPSLSKTDTDLTMKEKATEIVKLCISKNRKVNQLTQENKSLQSILDNLHQDVKTRLEGEIDNETPSALSQIQISGDGKSPINQSLEKANDIYSRHGKLKVERVYASKLLKELNDFAMEKVEGEYNNVLSKPPIQVNNSKSKEPKSDKEVQQSMHHVQLETNFRIASAVLEKHIEAMYMVQLVEELRDFSQRRDRGAAETLLSRPPKQVIQVDEAVSKKKKDKHPTEFETPHRMKLNKHFDDAQCVLTQIKETQLEAEYAARLLDELYDFIQTIDQGIADKVLSDPPKQVLPCDEAVNMKKPDKTRGESEDTLNSMTLKKNFNNAQRILTRIKEKQLESEYTARLLEELRDFSRTSEKGAAVHALSDPPKEVPQGNEAGNKNKSEKPRGESEQPAHSIELKKRFDNAQYVLTQIKEKQVVELDLQREKKKVEDLCTDLKKLHAWEDQKKELQTEVDNLRTRLSEVAGAKLTHNNPAIADLSDANRPTKLAETYSELYDNQWTDAFSTLSQAQPEAKEKDITKTLLDVLKDGFIFCRNVRQAQLVSLDMLMFDPASSMKSSQIKHTGRVNELFSKYLNEATKATSSVTSGNMVKAFLVDDDTKKHVKTIELCKEYTEKCVHLCWLMQIQSPPVCIDLEDREGKTFVKEMYREYTGKGKTIAFVVWPALFLHEKGPLLAKGVAQGKK